MQPKEPQLSVLASSSAAGCPVPQVGLTTRPSMETGPGRGHHPHAILPGPSLNTLYCPCDSGPETTATTLPQAEGRGGKAPAGFRLEAGFGQAAPSPAWIIAKPRLHVLRKVRVPGSAWLLGVPRCSEPQPEESPALDQTKLSRFHFAWLTGPVSPVPNLLKELERSRLLTPRHVLSFLPAACFLRYSQPEPWRQHLSVSGSLWGCQAGTPALGQPLPHGAALP